MSIKLKKLLDGVNYFGKVQNAEITNVTQKVENVKSGSLFVAIKGEKTDGNLLINKAVENGAIVIVYEDVGVEIPINIIGIMVDSSRKALGIICSNFYGNPSRKLKIVGITGTNGKTTTAYMIYHILTILNNKAGLIGTLGTINADGEEINNTTPEPEILHRILYKMLKNRCKYVILEISSQALAQCRTEGMTIEVGVFTNLSSEHLDYHKNMEEYFKSKLLICDISKIMIVNGDDDYGQRFFADKYYSVKKETDFYAKSILLTKKSISYVFCNNGEKQRVRIPLLGMFNVYNSLAAISTCVLLGFTQENSANALSSFDGVMGRIEHIRTSKPFDIIIDFAHTPESLKQLLITLRAITANRIITVFGCGGDRDRGKRPLMGKVATQYGNYTIITDDNPRTEPQRQIFEDILKGVCGSDYIVIPDRTEAIRYALEIAKEGDTIVLAGKGHELYQIIGTEKIHFDEREIILRLIVG